MRISDWSSDVCSSDLPLIATILSAAMLAAAPAAVAKDRPTGEEKLARMLEGRAAGEPRDCITLSSVTSSQVVDKTALVYRIGSTLGVNRPRGGAESRAGGAHILVPKLTGSQPCSTATLQLHDRSSQTYARFFTLGPFTPYLTVHNHPTWD